MPDPTRVRAMFSRIAPRYDLLNRVLSAGIDRRWRRVLLSLAGPVAGRRVVDVCCGTGDLALAFAAGGARVVAVDFTRDMLVHGRRRAPGWSGLFVEGDALHVPVATGAADLATVAFGIRNVADPAAALAELARVVRPGGRVFVLEFSLPRNAALRGIYKTYFTRVLPVIGGVVSGDRGAYRYLPDTVLAWPTPEEFDATMRAAGLVDCGYRLLSGGIACLSFGTVPGGDGA